MPERGASDPSRNSCARIFMIPFLVVAKTPTGELDPAAEKDVRPTEAERAEWLRKFGG